LERAGAAKADAFRALHSGSPILILPNAWDSASARVFEEAGFRAVATTSAGLAASLGYPDGERAPLDDVLWVVRHITETVSIPVSVDLEAGYGDTPEAVGRSCRAVLAAGAVGVNIEDGVASSLRDLNAQIERIVAAKEASGLFVNARTDVFLRRVGPPETWFDHAVKRANAYHDAGADCFFVPGVTDGETIERLAGALKGALNVLAGPGTPRAGDLERAGVARVTLGSGPMRSTMALTRRIAQELLATGTYRSFLDDTLPFDEANRLFSR
jgi:2-methylisocitrate lyase-like PEP mutase family enzyme